MKKTSFLLLLILLVAGMGYLTSCEDGVDSGYYFSSYSLNYNSDYGTKPESKQVEPDYVLTADDLPVLTDAHHDFLGWYNGTVKLEPGYKVSDTLYLTAKWANKKYTVTFVSALGEAPDPVEVEYEKLIDLHEHSLKDCAGYYFSYWTLNGEKQDYLKILDDTELTAKWTEIKSNFSNTWFYASGSPFKGLPEEKATFTKISFQKESYTGESTASWTIDKDAAYPITVYVNGSEIIVSGNGNPSKIECNTPSMLFNNFTNVTEIAFNDAIVFTNISSTKQMFANCNNLTTVDVSHLDTTGVTDMQEMFYGCNKLTKIEVSGFDTSAVTSMFRMFSGCAAVTELDVSQFDTSNATDMSEMFNGCATVTSLDLSSFHTLAARKMTAMFQSCRNLETIYVSDAFVVTYVSEDNSANMFTGCIKLKSGYFEEGGQQKRYEYNAEYPKDMNYAHVGTHEIPGYFTAKEPD